MIPSGLETLHPQLLEADVLSFDEIGGVGRTIGGEFPERSIGIQIGDEHLVAVGEEESGRKRGELDRKRGRQEGKEASSSWKDERELETFASSRSSYGLSRDRGVPPC